MRHLTTGEEAVLSFLKTDLGDVVSLHMGERGANLRHKNMDSIADLTKFLRTHAIHNYSRQTLGPVAKVTSECVVFDGRTAEISPISFNRAVSRGRNRFWIPALARMAQPDDMLGFGQDHGLLIVVNLSGVARDDLNMTELRALVAGPASPATNAQTAAESPEGLPSQAGLASSAEERQAMEHYSRALAKEHFESGGWGVQETVGSVPYDLKAVNGDEVIYVEVKSSKGSADSVLLTYGEVEHARESERSVLFIVSDVVVKQTGPTIEVSGGRRRLINQWRPDDRDLLALQYRYRVPAADWLGACRFNREFGVMCGISGVKSFSPTSIRGLLSDSVRSIANRHRPLVN